MEEVERAKADAVREVEELRKEASVLKAAIAENQQHTVELGDDDHNVDELLREADERRRSLGILSASDDPAQELDDIEELSQALAEWPTPPLPATPDANASSNADDSL